MSTTALITVVLIFAVGFLIGLWAENGVQALHNDDIADLDDQKNAWIAMHKSTRSINDLHRMLHQNPHMDPQERRVITDLILERESELNNRRRDLLA